ncbi:MAG: helix-turn-helix transcriptional regulator [Bacilli bacterium]|nr:helix-turn-helix transcriptional regulator [Bacilli bacterium]
MINIGERIRFIRETYDLTQNDLALILKINKTSISHIERNDRIIPIEHLITFSDYLNLSIDYILGLTEIKNYKDQISGIHLNKMAESIKEICQSNHLTNLALATIIHSCESNIRNYKNGKYLILTTFLLELNAKYNYSIDWILGKTTHKYVTKKLAHV